MAFLCMAGQVDNFYPFIVTLWIDSRCRKVDNFSDRKVWMKCCSAGEQTFIFLRTGGQVNGQLLLLHLQGVDSMLYCYFSRKTFRRRVLQKIVGVSHTTHIPHISHATHIPHISHTTHIPHISHTTHIPHISITPHISHTYPFKTYPTNTYPTNTYPFNTYPTSTYPCNVILSKRLHQQVLQYVSHQYVSVQHVSHQYVSMLCVSIQKVCISRNGNVYECKHILAYHCISRNGNVCECKTYPCISLSSRNGNEYEYHCMSFHTVYHCYSAGMVMNIETLLFLQFLCKIIN